jgi:ribosomal protection tetracycline resistance protein
LETVIAPTRPGDKGRLHVALTQLAEQDPLINLRQDEIRRESGDVAERGITENSVSLYGEVQKDLRSLRILEGPPEPFQIPGATPPCHNRSSGHQGGCPQGN